MAMEPGPARAMLRMIAPPGPRPLADSQFLFSASVFDAGDLLVPCGGLGCLACGFLRGVALAPTAAGLFG